MAKKKRRRKTKPPLKSSIKIISTKNNRKDQKVIKFIPKKKHHFWDKQLTPKQQAMFILTAITVMILAAVSGLYFSGKRTLDAQGYDSSDEVITAYFKATDTNDTFNLQRCYCLKSVGGNSSYKAQKVISDETHKDISFDFDTLEIETHEYNDPDDVIRNTKNKTITTVNLVQATVQMDKIVDKNTYTQFCLYRFITYEADSRWYIYAAQETMSTTIKGVDSEGNELILSGEEIDMTDIVTIGSTDTGYIAIGSDWTQQTGSVSDNIVKEIVYANAINTAEISLSALNAESAEIFAQTLYDTLSASDTFAASLSMTQNQIGNYTATLISCTDASSGQIFMAWIFDAPLHDSYVHYITLECTADAKAAVNYVNTFHF